MICQLKYRIIFLVVSISFGEFEVFSQNNLEIYQTGSTQDIVTEPQGGICLMGGAGENDEAMKWFLEQANGGDVVVLRASGSDGYNDYFYTDLGVDINSVVTYVFNNADGVNFMEVQTSLANAEGIWFAGGDQWNYVNYWRGTVIEDLINEAINDRNAVIGGTSAGMAIQGGFYFSAMNGTVTSDQALENPYHPNITVDNEPFIENEYLEHFITDTHFDNPDRKGRLMTFMARMATESGVFPMAIACNEFTAVCIDDEGLARTYGEYPEFEDTAYFISANCFLEATDFYPEICAAEAPLTWDLEGEAIHVFKVFGTENADNFINLNEWNLHNGGEWQNWSVHKGILTESPRNTPDCIVSVQEENPLKTSAFPNPVNDHLTIQSDQIMSEIIIMDQLGKEVKKLSVNSTQTSPDVSSFKRGVYSVKIIGENTSKTHQIVVD